jgi:hypothetical protein
MSNSAICVHPCSYVALCCPHAVARLHQGTSTSQTSDRYPLLTNHKMPSGPKRNLEPAPYICILTRTIARGRKQGHHATSPAIASPFVRSRHAPAPATPHLYAGIGMPAAQNRPSVALPFFGRALESEPATKHVPLNPNQPRDRGAAESRLTCQPRIQQLRSRCRPTQAALPKKDFSNPTERPSPPYVFATLRTVRGRRRFCQRLSPLERHPQNLLRPLRLQPRKGSQTSIRSTPCPL